jgi:acyl dehydratase
VTSGPDGAVSLNDAGFSTPRDARYFEDYTEGSVHEFGSARVELSEVIAFARKFDPQAMHVDPGAAAAGPFHGIIASGWHTASMMMRLFVDHYLSTVASLASPGIDELRWMLPVRPGDTLRVRVRVLESRPSTSKPDRGLVRSSIEVLNQRGEVAMSAKAMNIMLRRPA